MPQRKQPAAVVRAKGNIRCLTEEQLREREEQELRVPLAQLEPPDYLTGNARADFMRYRRIMLAVNEEYRQNVYCDLDADMLAAYVLEHGAYLEATAALHRGGMNAQERRHALAVQKAAFAHMAKCSSMLGLAVTDRMRLIVPGQNDGEADGLPDM